MFVMFVQKIVIPTSVFTNQSYLIRLCSTVRTKQSLVNKPDPRSIQVDYVGPPDEKSNLRVYVRCIPENETKLEETFRLKKLEVEEWNHKFWSNHNERFQKEKQDFLRLFQKSDLSAEEMSLFYKNFLDRNRKIHILYNTSWYIKNWELLYLHLKVKIEKFFKRTSGK